MDPIWPAGSRSNFPGTQRGKTSARAKVSTNRTRSQAIFEETLLALLARSALWLFSIDPGPLNLANLRLAALARQSP